jgi:hypothetical protein
LGRHLNRARMYDLNGNFRTMLPTAEAEQLLDAGDAIRASRANERPLRIKLLAGRRWQPRPYSPTSGCTSPACITARESELNALGATFLSTRADQSALERVRDKIFERENA